MLSQWSISALVLPIYEADSDLCYAIQVPMMSPAHPSPHPHRGCPHEHSPALPALNSLSQDLPPRSPPKTTFAKRIGPVWRLEKGQGAGVTESLSKRNGAFDLKSEE